MDINTELARLKRRAKKGEDINKNIEYEDLNIEAKTSYGYLVICTNLKNGMPYTPDETTVIKSVARVFDETMLPNPQSGSIEASIRIDDI